MQHASHASSSLENAGCLWVNESGEGRVCLKRNEIGGAPAAWARRAAESAAGGRSMCGGGAASMQIIPRGLGKGCGGEWVGQGIKCGWKKRQRRWALGWYMHMRLGGRLLGFTGWRAGGRAGGSTYGTVCVVRRPGCGLKARPHT